MCDYTGNCAFFRFYKVNILWTDDYIDRFIMSKSGIDTIKFCTKNLYQAVLYHNSFDDITLSDKVCYKSILWLIVDIFRRTHLLNIALIHNNNRIGHGKGFFLIVSDVDEGNTKFIF